VSEGRERGSATMQSSARVPSPVRERDRVRDQVSSDTARPSPQLSPARERGPVAPPAPSPRTGLPSPPLLRGVPSPVEGGGSARGHVPPLPAIPPPGVTPFLAGGAVLAVDAPFGRCTADALDRLAAAAVDLGADEIRLSPARGFVLLAADAARAAAHLSALAADFVIAPGDPRRAVAACTGAPACASGTTPTLADAGRLADAFRPLAARGLVAHVSGCAKGCARPAPADLTLVGRDGLYGIVVGGAPADPRGLHLPIEAALERLGRAGIVGLAAAFAPDGDVVATGRGRDRRPA
jgi:precorrin-3B synthase